MKIRKHSNSLGVTERNEGTEDSECAVFVLDLITVSRIHLDSCYAEVGRSKIEHIASVRELQSDSHIVLDGIHHLRIHRDIVAGGIDIADHQKAVRIIDVL